MKKHILAASAAALLALTSAAHGVVFLGLAIDGSGSISGANFALQRNAYASVLANDIPTDGSVGVGVWQFSSSVSQVHATTLINSQAALDSLVASLNAMTQLGGGTNIGIAIDAAANSILAAGGAGDKYVIDVSTDGFGSGAVTAATNALAAGVDNVNGLGIGAGANLNFVMGPDSFATQVASFADFETALSQKIKTETGQTPNGPPTAGVPEPSAAFPILLLGLATYIRRRRN